MSLISKRDIREISFGGLSNPEGMITAANANVHRIMPHINISDLGASRLGVVESGNVDLETSDNTTPITATQETPLSSPMKLRKRGKGKNTGKTKRKKQR
jgi:hypothetical protein